MDVRHPRGRFVPAACLACVLAMPAGAEPLPAYIEFVSPQRAQAQRPRPEAGILVLDLDGVESVEAARDLVDSWRRRQPNGDAPACWLRGRRVDDLLLAARQLTQGPSSSCGKVLIGHR